MRRWIWLLCLWAACAGSVSGQRPSALDLVLQPVDDRAAFEAPAVQEALDRATGYPRRPGNAAALLVDGQALEQRLHNGRGAELLLVKTFQLGDDVVGWRLASLMAERARAGAYVVLQYEFKVNLDGLKGLAKMMQRSTPEQPLGEPRVVRYLRAAGVLIVPTNSPTRLIEPHEQRQNAQRLAAGGAQAHEALERTLDSLQILDYHDHEKYWITGVRDAAGGLELRAILGGTSLSSVYGLGGTRFVDPYTGERGWRDTDIELRGPVVNDIVARFFDLTEHHLGCALPAGVRERYNQPQGRAGPAWVRFAWNQPAVDDNRFVERAYQVLFDATPRGGTVRLETAYFAPLPPLRGVLERALGRGVHLTLLTNSVASNNHSVVSWAGRAVYRRLLRIDAHVVLLERVPRPDIGEVTLHSKVASFGTRGPVIVGSANFDGQASEHCSESIVIVDDPQFRDRFDEMFLRDIAADRVDRVTAEDLRRDNLWLRGGEWLLYRLAGYYL